MPLVVKRSLLDSIPKTIFRIYKNVFPNPPDPIVFNADGAIERETRSATQLAAQMEKTALELHGKFLSTDGHVVDYKNLRSSAEFGEYKIIARELQHIDLNDMSLIERKAFFLNIYLALSLHGLTMTQPKSFIELKDFWASAAYNIGGHIFTLDDIEHGILRANACHPAHSNRQFKPGDPRLVWCETTIDPRIHFALNCGAMSCPAIRIYSADNLENALNAAAKSFCREEVKLQPDALEIHMSKIFEWYADDFGTDLIQVLAWIYDYVEGAQRTALGSLLKRASGHVDVSIVFRNYDWTLNTSS